jgi:peptidoglycan hydrolase CwlO-like protein
VNIRRAIVAGLLFVAITCGTALVPAAGQNPTGVTPDRRNPDDSPSAAPINPSAEKKRLEENEKDIKTKIERLYELATELKAEVDKTDSSKVLSLNLVKKAEEIEKLAHDIKNRSKG